MKNILKALPFDSIFWVCIYLSITGSSYAQYVDGVMIVFAVLCVITTFGLIVGSDKLKEQYKRKGITSKSIYFKYYVISSIGMVIAGAAAGYVFFAIAKMLSSLVAYGLISSNDK